MKVKCINNNGSALPKGIYAYTNESEFQISIGKEYTVYGITTIKRFAWYLICQDHYDGYNINFPMFIFSGCFEILDGRLSKFWKVAEDTDIYTYNERTIVFGFHELVLEKYFYSNLLEGEEREVGIFSTIKKVMDLEFEFPA